MFFGFLFFFSRKTKQCKFFHAFPLPYFKWRYHTCPSRIFWDHSHTMNFRDNFWTVQRFLQLVPSVPEGGFQKALIIWLYLIYLSILFFPFSGLHFCPLVKINFWSMLWSLKQRWMRLLYSSLDQPSFPLSFLIK